MLLEQYGLTLGIEEDNSTEIFYFSNFPNYTAKQLTEKNAIISLYYNSTTLADLAAVWEEYPTEPILRFDAYPPLSKKGRAGIEEILSKPNINVIPLFFDFIIKQAYLNEAFELAHKINSYVSK